MRILAFSPYHGGSHRYFFESYQARSRHQVEVVGLAPRYFKWRMRSGAYDACSAAAARGLLQEPWDVILSTTLLSLAELRGFLPPELRKLPLVAYFHENQFDYPVRGAGERDNHFKMSNWLSALAADANLFNSHFNRESFLSGSRAFLRSMPERTQLNAVDEVAARSTVLYPGVDTEFFLPQPSAPLPRPIHFAWCGRWEHDKNPEAFLNALLRFKQEDIPFSLTLLGQNFRSSPTAFRSGIEALSSQLSHVGYAESREEYRKLLGACDYCVSSADHEFFGLSQLEACALGVVPLVPDRLVYPELYPSEWRYPEDKDGLYQALKERALKEPPDAGLRAQASSLAQSYSLEKLVTCLDAQLEAIAQSSTQ